MIDAEVQMDIELLNSKQHVKINRSVVAFMWQNALKKGHGWEEEANLGFLFSFS